MYPTSATAGISFHSNTITATEAPTQLGRVLSGLAQQEKQLAALHEELSSLENRLSGVLRPSSPEVASGAQGNQPEATPSPIALSLQRSNQDIAGAILRVRGLLARLDV